jgi:hypothetical protein
MTGPAMAWLARLPGRVLILVVRVYQVTLSPLIGRQCRFVPSCSNYFIEAVQKRGVLIGTLKGIWRILRCQPFGRGGYDPVDADQGSATPREASSGRTAR